MKKYAVGLDNVDNNFNTSIFLKDLKYFNAKRDGLALTSVNTRRNICLCE